MRVRARGPQPKLCETCRTIGAPVPCSHCGSVVLRIPDRPRRWVTCSTDCRAALQHAERRAVMTDKARRKLSARNAERRQARRDSPPKPRGPREMTPYELARRKVWVSGQCQECREWFVITNKKARFCSPDCLRVHNNKWGKRTGDNKLSNALRTSIYERDKSICQLCFEPVDLTLPRGHRMSKTLDHIECQSWALIPDHRPSNLRLAHWSCNSSRQNRIAA